MSLSMELIKRPKSQLCVHCSLFQTLTWLPIAFGIEFLSVICLSLQPRPFSKQACLCCCYAPAWEAHSCPLPCWEPRAAFEVPIKAQFFHHQLSLRPQHSALSPAASSSSSSAPDWNSLITVSVCPLSTESRSTHTSARA